MQIQKKYLRLAIGIFLFLVVTFFLYTVYLNSQFRIVKTMPNPSKAVPTSLSEFNVEFNQNLDTDQDLMKSISDPAKHVLSIKIESKKLVIITKPHEQSKKYSFQLYRIASVDGRTIKSINFNYKAKYIDFNKLSEAEKELYNKQINSFSSSDPIIKHLPHSTLNFELSATLGEPEAGVSNKLQLIAKLFISNADSGQNEGGVVTNYKIEVQDYIKSLDLKPENYSISYIITYL